MLDRYDLKNARTARTARADLRLADGSPYLIRPSSAADRVLLIRCFEALSPQSRRLRFFTDKQRLTPEDLDLFCSVDGRDHIALAAVRLDNRGQEVEALGFARCLRLDDADSAEFSITVADAFHGQGIGSRLLDRLSAAAWAQGIRHFRCEVLMENAGMRRLAQKLGGSGEWLGNGVLEYDCTLREPTPTAEAQPQRPPGSEPLPSLPWYLDPTAWVEPLTTTWAANLDRLDRCLAWTRAANEDLGQWLDIDWLRGSRRDRTAA